MGKRREPALDKAALFKLLRYEPHEGQAAVHNSKARIRVLACGVRWGKTKAAAMEALAAAMEPRKHSKGWIVAPTYDLAERVFTEIQMAAFEFLRHRVRDFSGHDRRLVITNLGGGISEIRAKSADNVVSLLGEGLDFVVVDEAARLKALVWQNYLSQRLIDRKGWALLISTPKGKGWFYDLFRLGRDGAPEIQSWNAPSWQNPRLERPLIEAERERLPERTFLQEYMGEFIEGSGSVFRYIREAATGVFEEPVEGNSYCAGLDLAKVEDFSVLTILNKQGQVVLVDRFHRLDWDLQIERVRAACKRYKAWPVYVDSTGAGEPIYERLFSADVNVRAYPFTVSSKKALVTNLAMFLEQRKLILPKPEVCPELIDELEAFEYSVTDSGNVRTEAPSGMHDDCVISLALAAWGLTDIQREFRIFRIGRPPLAGFNDGWRPLDWNRRGFRLWP